MIGFCGTWNDELQHRIKELEGKLAAAKSLLSRWVNLELAGYDETHLGCETSAFLENDACFAGMAIQALVSMTRRGEAIADDAKLAYEVADAMMVERDQGEPK